MAAAERAATGRTRDRVEPDTQAVNVRLEDMVARLQSALASRLVSVILYGSGAREEHRDQRSDLNLLCVVKTLGADELARCGPLFHTWRAAGNPTPLLLTSDEVRTSTDCFPMEFEDMKEHRRVLYGDDVVSDLEIDRSFYRAQVEHELRAKQIRLRQKAADLLSAPDKLMDLMADSLSTFCVLGRHAMVLSGREARFGKAEIVADLAQILQREMTASNEILAVRSRGRQAAAALNPVTLFETYLTEVDALVRFVDGLER